MSNTQEWLDKGRALADQATQGPWDTDGREVTQHWSRPEPWQTIVDTEVSCMDFCYGGSAKGVERYEDAEFIADSRTRLPQALNALQAVLEIHKPFHADHYYNGMDGESLHRLVLRCDGCDKSGGIEDYPCPTVQAIQTELGRKETQS